MTKQHTPGPWFVTPDGAAVYEKDGYGYRGDTVCGLPSRSDSRAANARLIAAAPDLLEALKVAAKAELYDPATGLIDADVLDIVQDVARAAIAKATGGQS
jgi:hypothetical protein